MPVYTPEITTHYVIYNLDVPLVLFQTVEPGDALATGQPHVEPFTDEAAARARAIELGYVFSSPEDELPLGDPLYSYPDLIDPEVMP
jgi:hypothetical protein